MSQYFLEPIRKKDILDKEMVAKLFSNWEERTFRALNPLKPTLPQAISIDMPRSIPTASACTQEHAL